jgi:hypothetical protein
VHVSFGEQITVAVSLQNKVFLQARYVLLEATVIWNMLNQ